MRGVLGTLNKQVYIGLELENIIPKARYPLYSNFPNFGTWYEANTELVNPFSLVFSDLVNKSFIKLKTNVSFPKVKISVKLPDHFAVSELYIEDHLEILRVSILGKNDLATSTVNKSIADQKKVHLWNKLYFQYVAPPKIVKTVKDSPIGEIIRIKNSNEGIEI